MIASAFMAEERQMKRPALKEFAMRYTPAALALSLLAAVTASVSLGADRQPDPRAAALVAEGRGFLVHSDAVRKVERQLIDRAIESADPITMRTVERGHPLFGKASADMRSEALILMPARAPLPYGILLLGQKAETGLDAAHGAQLLGFLGDSLGAMMRRWLIDR